MKCRHQFDAVIAMPVAAQLGNRHIAFEQRLHRKLAQADDNFRLDQVDLPFQKWFTRRHFVGLGIAIFRRPALHHVADVNVLALDADAFGNNVRQ